GFDEYNSFDQIKDSRAIFLNLTYAITPQVTLRGGVRYTKDKVTIENFYALEGGLPSPGSVGMSPDIDATTWWTQTIGNPALYPAPPPNTDPTAPRAYFQQGLALQGFGVVPTFENDTNNVSGKVGVDWRASDAVLTYLSISQGYRGVAFNGQAYNDNSELTFAEPEKLTSYEIGARPSSGIAARSSTPRSSITTTRISSFSMRSSCRAAWARASAPSMRRRPASMAPSSNSRSKQPTIC